jgi:hypothetical protein
MAEREQYLFVVRVWREPSARGATWHGSLHEPASDRHVASAGLDDLLDFIAMRVRSLALTTGRESSTDEEKFDSSAHVARSPNEQDPQNGSEPGRVRR